MLRRADTTSVPVRFPLVDAMRAAAATLIAWHHFVVYAPLSCWEVPALVPLLDMLSGFQWAAQVFFVLGGFVMANSMSRLTWDHRQVGVFVVRRYCRLGLPYLAAIGLALWASNVGRGWVNENVVGPPASFGQILAHVVFLQDILGYESLSAGFWFVCIDFQLGLIYVAMLFLGGALARLSGSADADRSTSAPIALGWALALPAMFYFNLNEDLDMWAIYFFGQFFLGVMVYHGLKNSGLKVLLGLYFLMMAAALAYDWRWRLAASLLTGLALFGGGTLGLMDRWPTSRVVAYLGRTSYSLFLVHFPVFVVVSTLWAHFDWSSPWPTAMGLLAAYVASLIVADVFYRAIEAPTARLARKLFASGKDARRQDAAPNGALIGGRNN